MQLLRYPGLSIGICVLIVAVIVAGVRARGPVVSTAVAARTNLDQHVIASGRVRVVTRVQLSA